MTQEPMPSAMVGATLRELRQAKGWSLEDVSTRIKFSRRQIEALEAERWSDLPAGLSLRGLILNYSRLLGADGAVIAAAMGVPALAKGAQVLRRPSRARMSLTPDDERVAASWGWVLIFAVLLAAGLGYAFWQGWLPQQWLSFKWFSQWLNP